MEDLFYRGFDPGSPVESGTRHLLSAVMRLERAAELGWTRKELAGPLGQEYRALLSPENLRTLAVIAAAWVIATIVGGPLALAVDGVLLGLGAVAIYDRIAKLAAAAKQYAVTAYEAQDEPALAKAGTFFALAVTQFSVGTLEFALSSAAFTKARAAIVKRWPPAVPRVELPPAPQWKPRPGQPAVRPTPRPGESAPRVEATAPRPRSRWRRVADGARGTGALHAREQLPAVALGLGLGALVLLGGAAAAVAARRHRTTIEIRRAA